MKRICRGLQLTLALYDEAWMRWHRMMARLFKALGNRETQQVTRHDNRSKGYLDVED